MTDVLQAHVWDPAYNENLKKKKKQKEDAKEAAKEEEAKALAQKKEDVKCFCCGEKGHYSNECPKKDNIPRDKWADKGSNFRQIRTTADKDIEVDTDEKHQSGAPSEGEKRVHWSGVQCANIGTPIYRSSLGQQGIEKKNIRVLLDTGSTFTSVKDKEVIYDVKESDYAMKMNTNMGSRIIKKNGKIPGFAVRA